MLFAGGIADGGEIPLNGYETKSAELYNPVLQTFTNTGNLNTARDCHIAVLLPNGNVLIAGGYNSSGNSTNSAELYNPTTGEFTSTGSLTTARGCPSAALLNNGNVLVYGGYASATGSPLATSEIYNTSAGTFSSSVNLNTARNNSTPIVLPAGNVMALGGGSSSAEVYSLNEAITTVINPKYLIMGITYAPPGPSSSISFTDTNYVGNTTDITVQVSQTEGVSLTGSAGQGKESGGQSDGQNSTSTQGWSNGSWSLSGMAGVAFTQTTTNENSFTASDQISNLWVNGGTQDAFAPVDHDYDIIWLWLNPTLVVTADMSNPNAPLMWNGYGYDTNDPANGLDIIGVEVGNLNGNLPSADVTSALQRGWAASENLVWPNGDVAALTPTDYANILMADPFTNPNYTVILPSPCSFPCTTTDGRFVTAMGTNGTAESIYYLQQPQTNQTYTQNYATTSTSSSTSGNSTKISWAISAKISGSYAGFKLGIGGGESGSLTTTNTQKSSTTTTNTQTTAAKIVGPPCSGNPCDPSYSGIAPQQPSLFDVYQDVLYGGMMFFGVN